jgi:hypothetical protein
LISLDNDKISSKFLQDLLGEINALPKNNQDKAKVIKKLWERFPYIVKIDNSTGKDFITMIEKNKRRIKKPNLSRLQGPFLGVPHHSYIIYATIRGMGNEHINLLC